jgi:murein DD-endopeptidase MepM/ murein hydrolase activator NlpD
MLEKKVFAISRFFFLLGLTLAIYLIYPVKLAARDLNLGYPLDRQYEITSPYGWRIHPITANRTLHAGIDLGAPYGTPVLAARNGRVVRSGDWGGYGKTVMLEHSNPAQRTLYAHLSSITVEVGMWVEEGTVIGYVGSTGFSTGPHLHFEVQLPDDRDWVAIDPEGSFRGSGSPLQPPPSPSRLPPVAPEILTCDVALFGQCRVPPRCETALFGDCI